MTVVLEAVEYRFDVQRCLSWMTRNWSLSLYISALYLLLLFLGRRWMEGRRPYDLRRALVMWNTGQAAFSVFGTIGITPCLISILYNKGIVESVCDEETWMVPEVWIWAFLYALSKPVELGDTAFIVLRKSPLKFLHWYHHITVFIYSWYAMGADIRPAGHWFASMNYFVHAIMYSYYALRAGGFRVPSRVALLITLLQLLQMFVGVYINVLAYVTGLSREDCRMQDMTFFVGMVMYVSYAILFLNFLYHRYIKKSKQE